MYSPLLPLSPESRAFYCGEHMQEASFWKPFTFHGGCAYTMQSSSVWGSTGTNKFISDDCNADLYLFIVLWFHLPFGNIYWTANVILQLVENVATCLIKIVERVAQSSEMLDELCNHGLIQQVTHLLSLNGQTSLSPLIYNVSNFYLPYSYPKTFPFFLMNFKVDVNLLFCLSGIDRITCQTFIWVTCSLQDFIWTQYKQHTERDIIYIWPLTWSINFTACWWTL